MIPLCNRRTPFTVAPEGLRLHSAFCRTVAYWGDGSYSNATVKNYPFIGKQFGRLLIESIAGRNGRSQLIVKIRCTCGTIKTTNWDPIRKGIVISCGCYRREQLSKARHIHGKCRTVEYYAWSAARTRCTNPKCDQYHNYGGRGIKFLWKSFTQFIDELGERPSWANSIDRIDTNGNYEPGNCRWSTALEQGSNKRNNHWLEWNGEKLTLAQWAKRIGINVSTLTTRLRDGWTVERALSTPTKFCLTPTKIRRIRAMYEHGGITHLTLGVLFRVHEATILEATKRRTFTSVL